MILAVHGHEDITAAQLVSGLRARGHLVEAVSIDELVLGSCWELANDAHTTTWRVALADGRVIESRALYGLLNRAVPELAATWWPTASHEDARYAAEEWRALLLSALDAVPGPHVNRCTPAALTGPVWHPAEWRARALAAGLEIAREPINITGAVASRSAIVVGRHVVGELDDATGRVCVALAASLDCPFMEIFFDEAGQALAGTCLPEVPDPDDAIFDALGEVFSA